MEVKFSTVTVTVTPGAQPSFFATGWFSLRQFRGQHLLDYESDTEGACAHMRERRRKAVLRWPSLSKENNSLK